MVSFKLDWTFFGLTQKYRLHVQETCFDLVYYGKGFSYTEAYNLPVYLRNFFIQKLNKIFKERNKEYKKQEQQASSARSRIKSPRIKRPKTR